MEDITSKSEDIDQETFKKLSETNGIPKFTHICRACLCETSEIDQQLNTTMILFNKPQEIGTLIEESTGVKILDLDFLPNHICDKCLKTLRAWYKFRSHTQRSDEILKKYLKNLSTTLDNKAFPSTNLAIHLHGEKLDVIPTQDVSQIEDFQVTVVNDTPEVVGIVFHCDSCSMTFANEVDLEKHKEEHITRKPKAFKCEHCAKSFAHRSGLNNHVELFHILQRSHKFQCGVCGKVFRYPADFRLHKTKPCISLALIEQCKIRPVDVSLEEVIAAGEKAIRETKISCILCKKNFNTHDAFVNHYPKHKNDLTCSICKKDFRSVKVLETHVRKHLREKVCTCPICSRSYYSSKTMLRHIRDHSTREWVYRCNVCLQEFFMVREFEAHMLKHLAAIEDEKKNTAEQDDEAAVDIKNYDNIELGNDCESNSSDEDDWRNMPVNKMKDERSSSQEQFQLIKVEDDTEEDSTYKANKDTAVKIETDVSITTSGVDSKVELQLIKTEKQDYSDSEIDTDYEGSNQPSGFYTNDTNIKAEISDLEDNVKLENLDNSSSEEEDNADDVSTVSKSDDQISDNQSDDYIEKLLKKCKVTCHVAGCQTKCSTFTNIWGHFASEHLPEERPHKCSVCLEEFRDKFAMRSHIKKYYSFKCPVCQKLKTSCSDLKKHVIRTHPNRTFKCLKCDKTFARAATLKAHDITHSNTREFTCSVCSKGFFSENGLRLHSKSHEDIKELQCSICSKQFLNKNHLNRHYKACAKKKKETK